MDKVKTYDQVNRANKKLTFGISKMEDIYQKRNGQVDTPHRHDYFTILLIKKAKGKHHIDFKEYALEDNQIFFIGPGQVHQVVEDKKSYGYSIVFSNDFLIQNNIPIAFIKDFNLFNDFGASPPLFLTEEELIKLSHYANEILEIHLSDLSFKNDAIGALLKLILIRCNNLCSIPEKELIPEMGNNILRTFKALVEKNFMERHRTSEYANELSITADHLNRVVKTLSGKTSKEHIQSRIIIAAKRLLYFTDLTSKEIGYQLGFSEPANFSAFFKKCEGVSPSKFMKLHKE